MGHDTFVIRGARLFERMKVSQHFFFGGRDDKRAAQSEFLLPCGHQTQDIAPGVQACIGHPEMAGELFDTLVAVPCQKQVLARPRQSVGLGWLCFGRSGLTVGLRVRFRSCHDQPPVFGQIRNGEIEPTTPLRAVRLFRRQQGTGDIRPLDVCRCRADQPGPGIEPCLPCPGTGFGQYPATEPYRSGRLTGVRSRGLKIAFDQPGRKVGSNPVPFFGCS